MYELGRILNWLIRVYGKLLKLERMNIPIRSLAYICGLVSIERPKIGISTVKFEDQTAGSKIRLLMDLMEYRLD